ncbi:hypothetical protein B0A52_06092 [Exophiala mesophila]|uniref:Amidase domain-containing protein n=1 Tax=Exophiala mesophila TaxID=212818 RepID=A0A438N5A3_EXOME|nr:hypothetical protein B0A52_06092 [Exophiala mesophila]
MGSIGPSWQDVAAKRRDDINRKIPQSWLLSTEIVKNHRPIDLPHLSGLLSPDELYLTELSAVTLLAAIRNRRYSSVQVTRAFCKRAAIAHQVTNCLAEVLFDEALAQAEELDNYMDTHGKPKGMLHGLPVSVKEHIFVKGTTATAGLIAWADQLSPDDALIVRTFRDQGAVFHVKTTNPQTLMACETDSNLFGRTLNPHNPKLSSGGSTGGEGALIAMHGSPLGIGTDIGGSIRTPSAFCGIYGLKPSVARLPHSGLAGLHDGLMNVVGAVGPMATALDDLDLFCAAALAQRPWDHEPSLIELPWKKDVQPLAKLKIGVVWNDGVVHPHPPITRALQETVSSLRSAGHTVVDWDSNLHEGLINAVNQAYFLDGGEEYHEILEAGNEPEVPLLNWILETHATRKYTIQESWKLNSQSDLLRTLYARQLNATGVDALLCPTAPSVASVHNETRYWGYTSVFNALDLPAIIIPVSTVKSTDTWDNHPNTLPIGISTTNETYRALYPETEGPARYSNAPVGVQIVGRRLQEEKLLMMARTIEQAIRPPHQRIAVAKNGLT